MWRMSWRAFNAEVAIKGMVDAGFPGYETRHVLTHGESHSSSWFATLPAALRFIYGPAPVKP